MNEIRCHDKERAGLPDGPLTERAPQWLPNKHAERHGSVWCSWCGSLSIEDAIKALQTPGTHFSGADWKYGYPHKFYIEVRNPEPEKLFVIGSSNNPGPGFVDVEHATPEQKAAIERDRPEADPVSRYYMVDRRPMLYGKFYTQHLSDATEHEFQRFAAVSEPCFGIQFHRLGTKLGFRARAGAQQWGHIDENGAPVVEGTT